MNFYKNYKSGKGRGERKIAFYTCGEYTGFFKYSYNTSVSEQNQWRYLAAPSFTKDFGMTPRELSQAHLLVVEHIQSQYLLRIALS